MRTRFSLTFFIYLIIHVNSFAQVSKSFELRYVTNNTAANGDTDFKGEKEFLTLEQRVDYLKIYADYASSFFNDTALNKKVVDEDEVGAMLKKIKPQPFPEIRKRIDLNSCRFIGFKEKQDKLEKERINYWNSLEGVVVKNDELHFVEDYPEITLVFPNQSWRGSLLWKIKTPKEFKRLRFEFSDKTYLPVTSVEFTENGKVTYTTNEGRVVEASTYEAGKEYKMKLEFDFHVPERAKSVACINIYQNDKLIADYVPMERVTISGVGYAHNFSSIAFTNTFSIKAPAGTVIDDIWGIGYHNTGSISYPYTTETFIDEDFSAKPTIDGWEQLRYQDTCWDNGMLPVSLGSERYSMEDLYIRKEFELKNFDKVYLNIETLNPGGEIWINGVLVAAVDNRHPVKIEVSKYLKRYDKNLVAIKVNHFYLTAKEGELMPHSNLDMNIGWFCGRMFLDLVERTSIEKAFLYTESLENNSAKLHLKFSVKNENVFSFRGKAKVLISSWFPNEGDILSETEIPIIVGHGTENLEHGFEFENPLPWTPEKPQLYKVRLILVDENNTNLDDYVFTTGIRTLDQKNGRFNLNNKPYMLNGAQIMGFRGPVEGMIQHVLCAPEEWIIKELLMIKKMNGNFMRVHVHAWEFPAVNINDPRYCEYADQLGIAMIWGTPAWIRTGRGWGEIDWEGYPRYMEQVINHPSIMIWELSNHIVSFKEHDVTESNLFCKKAYHTLYSMDPSRLISFNSAIGTMPYGNDLGTIDKEGNSITPAPEWTAPMVTRGNQDAPTGYGKDWGHLRTWPDNYYKSFLNSKERAYFNFEHEESMAQPNWNLCKGKPWYLLHSYEWDYDKGSIGRRLELDEWRESQAWQAFSAWESMKKQRILDYDGFSWCCLHGGANSVTYKKPLIDFSDHAKLAFYTNKMIFQKTVAGSNDVDIVYGPEDKVQPVIMNWNEQQTVSLKVILKTPEGTIVQEKIYRDIVLEPGRTVKELEPFQPEIPKENFYIFEYIIK